MNIDDDIWCYYTIYNAEPGELLVNNTYPLVI